MRSIAHLVLATLLLASVASAQVPVSPAPVYTVEFTSVATEFPPLVANASVTAPVQVLLTLGNVICANQVTIPVALTASAAGAPGFFAVTVEPSELNMTISQGPHGSPPVGEPGTGLGDAVVRATITGNITANASIQVSVTASAPAPPGAPGGCQGAGAIGGAEATPAVIFANLTATPPPPEPTPEPVESPGVGVAALVAGLAVVAFVARRRR